MATSNRGGNRGGTRSRSGNNNNPEGRNQYSGGWRERPLTTAAAVGGAVAAGVFLWTRRNQISQQIGQLGEQIGEWREGLAADSGYETEDSAGSSFMAQPRGPSARKSQSEIAEEALTLKETGKSQTTAVA